MRECLCKGINEILLRRKNMIILPDSECCEHEDTEIYLSSFISNLCSYGFIVENKVYEKLKSFSKDELILVYNNIFPIIKKMVGADKEYLCMYPNFPVEVMEKEKSELFVNALLHYFSLGTWYPKEEENCKVVFPFSEETKYKVIRLGTEKEFLSIFTNLLTSTVSLSKQDYADITWAVKNIPNLKDFIPENIPMKETTAFLGSLMIREGKKAEDIAIYTKTATDVLRIVVAMTNDPDSDRCSQKADISLASNTRFKNLKRSERKMIMDLLSSINGDILEDLFRHEEKWKRLCCFLHQNEFKAKKYANVVYALNQVCAGKKPDFFGKRINNLLKSENYVECSKLLMTRPGEFARRLDMLLRKEPAPENRYVIIFNFAVIAAELTVPMLLELREHFLHRNKNDIRIFMPKGGRGIYVKKEDPKKIDESEKIVSICECELVRKLSQKEHLGKVYISDKFRDIVIPFSQRKASDSFLNAKTKGSRIKLEDNKNIIRPFIWWTNCNTETNGSKQETRVDLDLSVGFYDENWSYKDHVSYTNLSNSYSVHSGDITNGGPVNETGVAEFIDIDIRKAKENEVRYAVIQLYSYRGQPMSIIPNRFGVMARENISSGEIFEPRSVEINGAVTADGNSLILGILDLKDNVLVWADIPGSVGTLKLNNLEDNLKSSTAAAYAVCNMNRTSLYDLIMLNAIARGQITINRNDADIIFDDDTKRPVIEVMDENGRKTVKEKENVAIIPSCDLSYILGLMA